MEKDTKDLETIQEVADNRYNKKQCIQNRQRGGCLTAYLLFSSLMVVPGLIGLYVLYTLLPKLGASPSHLEIVLYNNYFLIILGCALYGIGLVGAWMWKKWGIILMASAGILVPFTDVVYSNYLWIPIIQSLFSAISSSIILYIIVRRKWNDFH